MESGGAGGGGGGSFVLLTKPGFIKFHQKPLFPFKSSRYISRRSYIAIVTPTTTSASYRPRDSNAETVGSKKFKFKFRDKNYKYRGIDDMEEQNEDLEGYRRKGKKRMWWSEGSPDMVEEEDAGILEEFVDSLWILKVFKSYGWALPPIILSLLLATGPKAFLMTLALPLGQSVLTFLFGKLWGRTLSKPKSKARKKRESFGSFSSNVEMDDEEQEERQKTMKGDEFQSWVVNGSVNKDSQGTPNFGGWDELDGMESMQQPPKRARQTQKTSSATGKLGRRRRRERDAPLLLRLLVALFPFLGSWTKML